MAVAAHLGSSGYISLDTAGGSGNQGNSYMEIFVGTYP